MTTVHHAILVRANSVSTYTVTDIGSDEVRDLYVARFGIDDARELVRTAYQCPIDASEQVLIVRTDFITLESQNALLKLLEEPPASTRFVFVLPPDFIVLPTLASRVIDQGIDGSQGLGVNEVFSTFINSDYKDRILGIDKASKQKDSEWQRSMKQGLIQYLSEIRKDVLPKKELEYASRTLLTRGASNKMLLEQVALTLPIRS